MSATTFNPDARTTQDVLGNCEFLTTQVSRWVELTESMPEDPGVMDAAQAAAEALARQATLLVIKLRRTALERAAKTVLQKVTEGTKAEETTSCTCHKPFEYGMLELCAHCLKKDGVAA